VDIRQRNVFGDNIVTVGKVDRMATPELADELVIRLKKAGASAVAIHFEHDGETAEFVDQLAVVLGERMPVVGIHPHSMSGFSRNTVLVEGPQDGEVGFLRIGTL
jgi:hypothetical protein